MCTKTRFAALAIAALACCAWGLAATQIVRGGENRGQQLQQRQADTRQAEPQPITLNGKGRQASQKFQLEPGLCLIDFNHDGTSNLIVRVLDMDGKELDTVFNQIGAFNARRGLFIPKGGEYLLDVVADGNWSANLRQPRPTTGQTLPAKLQGKGFTTTDFIQLDKGLTVFKMNHEGENRFRVTLLDREGKPIKDLINTLGNFSGSKPVRIEKSGIYFLNVSADGDWTIDVNNP